MNMEVSIDYSIQGPDDVGREEGEGTVSLSEDRIVIQGGRSVYQFPYRDISAIDANNYTINLAIEPETSVTLRKLGRRYEDVVRRLHKHRNAILIEDMLIDETRRRGGIEADLEYNDPTHGRTVDDSCEVSLYDTAIVFFPRSDLPIRLPFGLVTNVEAENYTLKVETDRGETALLSNLGRQFEPFQRDLNEALADLTESTVTMLDERLPEIDQLTLNRLAELMRDGRAVSRSEIEEVAGSDVWDALIESLDDFGVGEEYSYLASKAVDRWISTGIKRGLTGDLDGDYLWFLLPIGDIDQTERGNAVVMEAAGMDAGRATYLFQITAPDDYAAIDDQQSLDRVVAETLSDLNHAMLAINFRREPIYLPRERLTEPRYANYRSALRLVPALNRLREAFIGRVSHRSLEQWRRDIDELLATAVTERAVEEVTSTHEPDQIQKSDSDGGS